MNCKVSSVLFLLFVFSILSVEIKYVNVILKCLLIRVTRTHWSENDGEIWTLNSLLNRTLLQTYSPADDEISHTYGVHVDPVGVGPFVLEVLLQSLPQRVWNLVEADELPNSDHLSVIARCPRVQPLDDG